MNPRILITSSTWVPNIGARNLVTLWHKLTRHLNPGIDLYVVDSASQLDPRGFLPDTEVFRFEDNIGHYTHTGAGDGASRAYCKCIEVGIERGYDYAVFIESDVLLARPVTPWIERMQQHAIKFAAPMATPYHFMEAGLSFMDLRYLQEIDFLAKNDWRHPDPTMVPEQRVESLLGEEFWMLPLRGFRNDAHSVGVHNIKSMFPRGLDWITHCRHFDVYLRFLEMNGIRL